MVSRHDTGVEPGIVVGGHQVLRLGFRCSSKRSSVVVGRKCQGAKGKRIRGVHRGQGHDDYGLSAMTVCKERVVAWHTMSTGHGE